jgi:hypothetical protein
MTTVLRGYRGAIEGVLDAEPVACKAVRDV